MAARPILHRLLPRSPSQRFALVCCLVLVIGLLFSWFMLSEPAIYGLAIFVVLPFYIGFLTVALYGYRKPIKYSTAVMIGLAGLFVLMTGIFIVSMEGMICLIMAIPISLVPNIIGSSLAFLMISRIRKKTVPLLFFAGSLLPASAYLDHTFESDLMAVTTIVEINAPPEKVWPHVIKFPKIPEPKEWLFKLGLAFPVEAEISGEGVGAVRYCRFNTGDFVEPITRWDEPHLLEFDVISQPEPMQELSIWSVHPPHLKGYFVTSKGRFKLTALPGNKCRLEGTTWYTHKIFPQTYWKWWSQSIIHDIHERVLKHIQLQAETE